MSETWDDLSRKFGRKCVMNTEISDGALDKETERQASVIFPMLAKLMSGTEHFALDYGCGYGRFTRYLHRLLKAERPLTIGFDPSRELVWQAPIIQGISWEASDPAQFFHWNEDLFDVTMCFCVLGEPSIDTHAVAEGLARVTKPNGMVVIVDHMNPTGPGRWWQFRSPEYYKELFARYGIILGVLGHEWQLDNQITIMCNRQ